MAGWLPCHIMYVHPNGYLRVLFHGQADGQGDGQTATYWKRGAHCLAAIHPTTHCEGMDGVSRPAADQSDTPHHNIFFSG